jgi:hypothetical protein
MAQNITPLKDPLLIIMVDEEGVGSNQGDTITFEFPIKDPRDEAPMKNSYPLSLPNFNGLSNEYLYTFIFEFDVLCKIYDYTMDT